MLVRVKETQVESFYGFYGLKRRYPGEEFKLEAKKDQNGKTITAESQFSDKWMEKVNKPGPKPKQPVENDSYMS